MTENRAQNPPDSGSNGHKENPRNLLVVLLGLLVSVEAGAVFAGALYFLSRIFLETPGNFLGALVIFTITILIAIGLIATAVGTFRAQPWTRGAIVTWQILQFVIATSFIQGIAVWQPLGWSMIALSIGSVFLVFKEMYISK